MKVVFTPYYIYSLHGEWNHFAVLSKSWVHMCYYKRGHWPFWTRELHNGCYVISSIIYSTETTNVSYMSQGCIKCSFWNGLTSCAILNNYLRSPGRQPGANGHYSVDPCTAQFTQCTPQWLTKISVQPVVTNPGNLCYHALCSRKAWTLCIKSMNKVFKWLLLCACGASFTS